MNAAPVKPWGEFEDDADVAVMSASESPGTDPTAQSTSRLSSIFKASSAGRKMRRIPSVWALVPIGIGTVWLFAAGVFGGFAGGGISRWHAVIGVFLNLIGAGLIIVARMQRRRAMGELRDSIRSSPGTSRPPLGSSPLGGELGPLWEAVEAQCANSERRMSELSEQRQQLLMEVSLASTQKRQIEAIIQSILEPILVADPFDQLLVANPAAEDLFGFKAQDSHRRPLAELIQDERLLKSIRQSREADSHSAKRRFEQEFGNRAFAVSVSPVESASSAPGSPPDHHGVVVMMRDITKEREASKAKSEFVAKVTHELRTPLSSICAYVEMLTDGEAEDERTRKEYYDIIQGSADRLNRLIDNMLNISRIEAGTIRINLEPMALSVVVQEAVEMARPQADAKSIEMSVDVSPAIFRVNADRDLIYQAVLNLLSNAVKYTMSGGQVAVKMVADEPNRLIHVQVSDTGVGIPPEDLPKMFQKFFRVAANKDVAKGTGLGLNLVKHIVETVHEGKMTLTSEVGKGSTFTMTLPLV